RRGAPFVGAGALEAGGARRAARGDEHARRALEHAPPARPAPQIRAEARAARRPPGAARGPRRSVSALAARKRARLPPDRAVPRLSPSPQPPRAGRRMALIESNRDPAQALFDQVVESGAGFTRVIARGQTLRIVDLEGNQAVDTLFYNAADPLERYSAVDTVREQG